MVIIGMEKLFLPKHFDIAQPKYEFSKLNFEKT